jgi:hypothetical protein
MPGRRPRLARRLLNSAVDVVSDRAPGLTDQAYRIVATPLQWVDPAGGARTAAARLDSVRDRIAAMATSGRAPEIERQRIARELARTREDLERLTPRLPAVEARALARRLDTYTEAVAAMPVEGGPGARPARARNALAATGAAAGATAGLFLPMAEMLAVEGGIAAAVATAVGVSVSRARRARAERRQVLTETLSTMDRGAALPVPVPDLDRDRRALIRRAYTSGRLDARGTATLRTIDQHLDDLLVRLVEGELDTHVAFLVTATVTQYLPDTLEPYLALVTPQVDVRGRPAAAEVADQLASIERGLAAARSQVHAPSRPETQLLLQGEFLRDKFGSPPEVPSPGSE